jgi:S1-C subfamily serine protease
MAREVMSQIIKYGEIRRGQLGIAIQDLTPERAQSLGLPARQTGALVAKVEPGSAAERASVKPNDVITAINKSPVRGAADLRNKVGLLRVGESAELTILRAGQQQTLRATIQAQPQQAQAK